MTKEKIFDYLRHTPLNTNFSILGNMLDELACDSGSSGSIDDDVLFIDYDGTILYSYSLSEIQTLTALPKLPFHSGLICQGWNWTLDEIKARNCPLIVGAVYITDDGATRIRIKVGKDDRSDINIHFMQSVDQGIAINWGDGSAVERVSGAHIWNDIKHIYASAGEFIISLLPDDGCDLQIGDCDNQYGLIKANPYDVYSNMVREINFGKNFTIVGAYTCISFRNLETITIPNYVTTIEDGAFDCCYALKAIVIPKETTFMGISCFHACVNLRLISLPAVLRTISDQSFGYCYSLTKLTIPNTENIPVSLCRRDCSLANVYLPDNLKQIHRGSFSECCSLKEINIPNLVNLIDTNAFAECESLSKIDISNCSNFQTFGAGAFEGCTGLLRVTFANNTEIPAHAFSYCSGVRYYDFTACSAIPTLSNINAFEGISVDCQILVPASLYDTWIAANNWSTLASHIVAV